MMLLIKNADIHAPEHLGCLDLFVTNGVISGAFPRGEVSEETLRAIDPALTVIDAGGAFAMPGIIDSHVHFNGAGGEGGASYRTPPLQFSSFVKAGVTSAVGLLGTDGTCRSLRDLLMKARGLEEEGISTWIYTGNYRLPSPTITGGIIDDICLIDKVIGLKMALSDHRSAHPSIEAVRQSASDSRVGGILSGKCGVVCVHMGDEPGGFAPIIKAVEGTKIPLAQFLPTHVSRNNHLLTEAVSYTKAGGNIDLTASPTGKSALGMPTVEAVRKLISSGVSSEKITISSDGNGSMPRFNDAGEFVGMSVAPLESVFASIMELLDEFPNDALSFATSNVAKRIGATRKGRIKAGYDADILLLNDKKITHVIARGQILMNANTIVKKGTFEA